MFDDPTGAARDPRCVASWRAAPRPREALDTTAAANESLLRAQHLVWRAPVALDHRIARDDVTYSVDGNGSAA